jgi:trimeric autotransporter adhesin
VVAPTVVTEKASSVAQTTATLNAMVNPNGGEVTKCEFEYGTTTAYKSGPVSCASLPGNGSSAVAVAAAIGSLTANTTYHFRISATNAGGTGTGIDGTFKTLPNPPTVSNVSPNAGPTAGGTSVTITGTNFSEATAVEFGSASAMSFKVVSPTSITAVSPAGTSTVDVTVSTPGGTSATGSADKFSYVVAPTVVTEKASSVAQTTATLNAMVNPNGGEVTKCEFEYGTTESYGSSVSCSSLPGKGKSAVEALAPVSGLTKNTTYHFRIVATNSGGVSSGGDQSFLTAPGRPTVVTGQASSIGQTSMILNATVNPNGGMVTECYFHYGTVKSGTYEGTVPCVGLPLSGTKAMPVSALAENLSAGTSYNFSLEATNSPFGETGFGEQSQPFETLPGPSVVTGAATSVTQTSATLNATVNPNGGNVSECHFEFGTSTAYGSSVPCSSLPGSGAKPVEVIAQVEKLIPNTTYFFRIVATNPGGTSRETVGQTFTTLPNPPVVATAAASSPKQAAVTVNGSVNPNGGTVSDCHFEYGTSTAYGASTPCSSLPGSGTSVVAVSAVLKSLSANTTYNFRIVGTNAGGTSKGSDETFKTLPDAPTVVTVAATAVTQTSASLNATVNPNGGAVSDCKLEYGTSASYGSSVSCTSLPGSGNSAVPVSAPVEALKTNTTYYFRIIATNAGGTGTDILNAQTVKTLPNAPTVFTKAASLLTQTTATLSAMVNPNGGEVSDCHFEYGPSSSYGSSMPCSSLPGAGMAGAPVSAPVVSLSANTTYHFRIVATNAGGASLGADQPFTTAPVPPTTTTETTLTTTTSSKIPVATCKVSLASTSVTAQTGGMAAIKLIWTGTGTGTCGGKLTLTVKTKGKSKRSKQTLIGTGAFSIPSGNIRVVRLKLNGAGRALLNAGHGRLSASLAILKLFPGPSQSQTETVHLAQEARSSSKRGK